MWGYEISNFPNDPNRRLCNPCYNIPADIRERIEVIIEHKIDEALDKHMAKYDHELRDKNT